MSSQTYEHERSEPPPSLFNGILGGDCTVPMDDEEEERLALKIFHECAGDGERLTVDEFRQALQKVVQ